MIVPKAIAFARYCPTLFLFLGMLLPGLQAKATVVCPTTTLDNLITLGTCTIGDATFSFTSPKTYGGTITTEWFAGPYVGDSGAGPSAGSLLFTPDATAGNPGFTISGNFAATGGFSCKFLKSCGPGNFFDEELGRFDVSGPKNFVSLSTAIGGANVSTDDPSNVVFAGLIGAYAYLGGDGSSSLFATYDVFPQSTLIGLNPTFRTWDYSTDPNSIASFTSATFNFREQAATTAPEPSSLILLASGFLALAGGIRRKIRP